jgi:methyl-accepting chemotaxis protein
VIAAAAMVTVMTLALGLFAIQRLSSVNGAAADLRDNWLPVMRVLGDLRYHATRYRSIEGSSLLPTSEADHQHAAADLDKYEVLIAGDLAKFEALSRNDEQRELAASVKASWAVYLPMRAKEFELAKGENGTKAAADFFTGDMKTAFNAFYKPIEAAVERNAEGGEEAGNKGEAAFESARLWIFIALAIGGAMSVAGGWFFSFWVSTPLAKMIDVVTELASGRLDTNVPPTDRKDEIGKLAQAMVTFKAELAAADRAKDEQTKLIVSSVGAGLARLAEGDLTARIETELTGAFRPLKDDFNRAMDRLDETMREVRTAMQQIAGGAGDLSQSAEDLSRRTEQQAANIEETAAALEEITTTARGTASNAKRASENVRAVNAEAEKGERIVTDTVAAMDAIAQSSRQITDIIGVIDEIAFQTNLLALNAGVEAARAGDAGRGFAVVASEVRELAQRSSAAAKEIKQLINASAAHVGTGVQLAGLSGEALRGMAVRIVEINSLVTEMAQAAERQSDGVEEVSSAVSQVEQITQQNAAMVEESTAATRNLANETDGLMRVLAFFRTRGAVATGSNVTAFPARRTS